MSNHRSRPMLQSMFGSVTVVKLLLVKDLDVFDFEAASVGETGKTHLDVGLARAWISRCRRLTKDYERNLESSLAWSQLAAFRFMARRAARAATC